MRKVLWAGACVGAGALVALAFAGVFRSVVYSKLPHLREMQAACSRGEEGAPEPPRFATPAKCRTYFAEAGEVARSAKVQVALTGVLAAYILLVLRFRVYPLSGSARPHRPAGRDAAL